MKVFARSTGRLPALVLAFSLWPAVVPAAAPSAPATSAAATASAATAPAISVEWKALVAKLASDDFATREAAQKTLDQTTWRDLDTLKRLVDAAGDAEAQSRISARVEAIEEQLAVNPAPISMELNKASLFDVADELGKAIGQKVEVWPPIGQRNPSLYTLSAKEKPFWEVLSALSSQGGIRLESYPNVFRLNQGEQGLSRVVLLPDTGLAVEATSITLTKSVNLQAAPGGEVAPPTMNFSYQVMADPRMKLVANVQVDLTEVTDDLGNTLHQQTPGNVQFWGGQRMYVFSYLTSLNIPEKMGTKIASAKGQARFKVALGEVSAEVADIDKKLNQDIPIGNHTVKFTQWQIQQNTIQLQFNIAQPPGAPRIGPVVGPVEQPDPVHVSVVNANGETVWSQSITGSLGGSIGGNLVQPIKVVFTLPTKTKVVTAPFELKDLPLPR